MKIEKKYIYVLVAVIVCLLYFGYQVYNTLSREEEIVTMSTLEPTVTDVEYIVVDIKGQVLNEGVYKVIKGTRLYQLIIKAGGLTKDAKSEFINQSIILDDEMMIYIPSIYDQETEVVITTEDSNEDDQTQKLININTASKSSLESIPGIGSVTADSIITYRESNTFETIEDIMNVTGIGESTFEKIKSYITVS